MAEPVGPGPGPGPVGPGPVGPDGTVPDGRNPRTLAIIAGLAVLLVVGIVALLVAAQSDDDGDVVAGSGTGEPDQVTTTDQASTTLAPTTAPTTTEAPVAAPPLTSGPAATPPPTTSGPVETRPTFTMSPTSGPPGTRFTASGTGCTGERAGAALTVFGPDGQGMTGTGAASMPDGSWTLEESIPVNGPTGEYRVEVNCMQDSTVLFSYAPQTFRAT